MNLFFFGGGGGRWRFFFFLFFSFLRVLTNNRAVGKGRGSSIFLSRHCFFISNRVAKGWGWDLGQNLSNWPSSKFGKLSKWGLWSTFFSNKKQHLSKKKIHFTAMVIIFWEFLMFHQFFLSPQVKRGQIISNKLVYTICLSGCRTT